MYKTDRDFENEIVELLLREGEKNIKEVSKSLDISRTTAEKYLLTLEARDKIKAEFIGTSKFYRVKK